jgi:hypothetical protein
MKFEIYCDESHPELFTSTHPTAQYLTIGSLWLPASNRRDLKQSIWALRKKHNTWGEIKWRKVSAGQLPFYLSLIDLFIEQGEQLRFRCIAIDHADFSQHWRGDDHELGFYKFYYQLLHHWILDFNEYSVFCDSKTNRDLTRLSVLQRCLDSANLSAGIQQIQALPSKQVVLIQLTDLLLGAVSSQMNNTLREDSPKQVLVLHLEKHLGRRLSPTARSENKLNIFKINLRGGW